MPHAPADIKSLARQWTGTAISTLAHIASDPSEDAGPRVSAAIALLDRGWGKPQQTHAVESQTDIRVVVRHIIDGKDVITNDIKMIEHKDGE